jgi:dTMP kinase
VAEWVPSPIVSDRPPYIAFEGAEGCGKSTQAARLAAAIGAVLTRETGGTEIGARLRSLLHDTTVHNLHPRAEALITAADRAQHIAEVVAPALASGRSVVSDRSVYSSLAYQGYGRELDVDEIHQLNAWGTGGVWPTTVVFLDTPDDVIAERMSRRDLDRFEAAGEDFHARVLAGFRTMAAAAPDHWITVQAVGSVERVADDIRRALDERDAL